MRNGILNHSVADEAETLEGKIVKFADRIAYINHDIDDAIRAGVLSNDDIPKDIARVLGNPASERIDKMVNDVIINSSEKNSIMMSDEINSAMNSLRSFMFSNVYLDERSRIQGERIEIMLSLVFEYYMKNTDVINEHIKIYDGKESLNRMVIDYIAGMTDQFAIEKFEELFLPTGIRRV